MDASRHCGMAYIMIATEQHKQDACGRGKEGEALLGKSIRV